MVFYVSSRGNKKLVRKKNGLTKAKDNPDD